MRDSSSQEVASVLRQSGVHVCLIVSRNVVTMPEIPDPAAPVIPIDELDEHLMSVNQVLDLSRLSSEADISDVHTSLHSLPPV